MINCTIHILDVHDWTTAQNRPAEPTKEAAERSVAMTKRQPSGVSMLKRMQTMTTLGPGIKVSGCAPLGCGPMSTHQQRRASQVSTGMAGMVAVPD